jgi:hypothetical protein
MTVLRNGGGLPALEVSPRRCLRVFPLLALFALLALSATPAQAVGTISTFTRVDDLDFGDFTVLGSCSNCTITIDAATGTRSASGGVILRSSNGGNRGQYSAKLQGCGTGCSYTAGVSPSSLNLTTSGGTMTVTAFTFNQTAYSGPNGTNTLYVGGTLRIPSVSVTAGSYTSSAYTVTATP